MIHVEPPAFRGPSGLARAITVAGIAGVIAGVVVGGAGGRLFMRIAAASAAEEVQGAGTEAGFTVGEITREGTAGLLLFVGILSGLVGAAWFVIFRPWLAWTGRWRGAAFGVLLVALASATSDALNPDNVDFLILGNPLLLVGLIGVLFVGFGLVIEPASAWLDRRLPGTGHGHRVATVAYVVVSLLGVFMGGALLIQALFTRNICDCDPPISAAIGTSAAAIGTAIWMLSAVRTVPARMLTVSSGLGFAGSLIAATGLVRAFADAATVVAS